MSRGGPKPSAFYVERQLATRLPATPVAVTRNGNEWPLTNLGAYGQTDPGVGTQRSGDGLFLSGLMAVTVSIWPNPGMTLTGGSLLAWLWNPFVGQWSRYVDGDLTVQSGTYTGPVGYSFAVMRIPSRHGWLMNYTASSLTGTSADFLIRLDGFQSVLGMGTS